MKPIPDKALLEFAELQRKLLTVLLRSFPAAQDDFMATVPKRGDLALGVDAWSFRKHGRGVMFENSATGTVIDAHRIYSDIPSAIDAWRLMQFLESTGICSLTEHEVEDYLRDALRSGVLVATGHYGVYAIRAGAR